MLRKFANCNSELDTRGKNLIRPVRVPALMRLNVPQYSIPPGGVEGERADLIVPLDAVDGELTVGGGGGDVGGEVCDQTQSQDSQNGPGNGQESLPQEDDPVAFPLVPDLFGAKVLHEDPVLSSFLIERTYAPEKKSCGKGRKRTGSVSSRSRERTKERTPVF